MKKCEMRIALPHSVFGLGSARIGLSLGRAGEWGRAAFSRCGLTFWFGGGRASSRLTMTRSSSCKPLFITRRLLKRLPERHVFHPDDAIGIDDQHVLCASARLPMAASETSRPRCVGRRTRYPHPCEHPGRKHAVRIGEHRRGPVMVAGRAVDHVCRRNPYVP